jgi:adenylate cyclase
MSTEKGRILAVDDEMINRVLLSTNLQEAGYVVETAEDGQQAWKMLSAQPFDVVLLDLIMPEMDGYQVLARMKSDDVLRHIPVIVISSMDEIESVVRCIEMGATDYLTKPFNPVLLHARLNASLASKRMHDMERAYLKQIQVEQEKSERLLLSILPQPVAEQLKRGQQDIAENFAEVTVLFADLVGFTPFAARNSPAKVLRTLNIIFSAFDQLSEHYQLEKIKTIGDEYMVAGGLPLPRTDHAEAVADLALDMQAGIARLNAEEKIEPMQLRIGIHSGPVIAGVIGAKKFAYDLWGDTVNTAHRMQSNGVAGGILVSDATYVRLRGEYLFQEQGMILVKGKGDMMTYLLAGRKAG